MEVNIEIQQKSGAFFIPNKNCVHISKYTIYIDNECDACYKCMKRRAIEFKHTQTPLVLSGKTSVHIIAITVVFE